MSEFRDTMAAIVQDRASATSELCTTGATGKQFYAEYEEISPLELATELYADLREAARLHVLDKTVIPLIQPQTKIIISLFGQNRTFMVIRRENNPGNPQATYVIRNFIAGMDA